jgi:hypothetical protein
MADKMREGFWLCGGVGAGGVLAFRFREGLEREGGGLRRPTASKVR